MSTILSALSGPDNKSIDLGRVILIIGFVFLCGMQIAAFLRGQPWDIVAVSGALSAYGLSMCGGIRLKASTEPSP